jgi:hypothetical protein
MVTDESALLELGSPYLFRRPLSLSAVKRAASNRRCAACLDVIGGVLPAGLTDSSGLGALSSAMVREGYEKRWV